jgi:hypothetical protein
VDLTKSFVVSKTDHLFDSIVEPRKDRKNRPHRKNIVEVGNNVVRVMESYIKSSVCKNNASNTTNGEEEDETDCKQHGGTKIKGTSSHGRESAKDLDTGGNGNNHSGSSEIRTSINV